MSKYIPYKDTIRRFLKWTKVVLGLVLLVLEIIGKLLDLFK